MAHKPTVVEVPGELESVRYRTLTIGDPTLDCLEKHGRDGRSPVVKVVWGRDILVGRRNKWNESTISLIKRPGTVTSEKAIWSEMQILADDSRSDIITPLGIFGGYVFFSSQPPEVANAIELWATPLAGGEPTNLSNDSANWQISEMNVAGDVLTFNQIWTSFTRFTPKEDRFRSRCFEVSVNKGELQATLLPNLGNGLVVYSPDRTFAARACSRGEETGILLLKNGEPANSAFEFSPVRKATKVESVSNQGDVFIARHPGADEKNLIVNRDHHFGLCFHRFWEICAQSPNGDHLLLREGVFEYERRHLVYSRDGSFRKIDCAGYAHVEWEAIEDDRSLFGRGVGIDPAHDLSFRRDVLLRADVVR